MWDYNPINQWNKGICSNPCRASNTIQNKSTALQFILQCQYWGSTMRRSWAGKKSNPLVLRQTEGWVPFTVWALSPDKYTLISTHTRAHTHSWPWVLYSTHSKCCVGDTGTHHSQPSQHIALVSWFTQPISVCLYRAHKQMHVGSYNCIKRGDKESQKEVLSANNVFVAYMPTKPVIMCLCDLCGEALWGKEKKKEARESQLCSALRWPGYFHGNNSVLQVDRSPEPNRERQALVKNDLNTTLSHRLGT